MRVTASRLRQDVYRILDGVVSTGVPVEVERRGHILKIVLEQPPSKLDRLVERRSFIKGDPDDLVHVDWSSEWHP